MRLFLFFLFSAFLAGASPTGRRLMRHRIVLLGATAFISAMFYSYGLAQ